MNAQMFLSKPMPMETSQAVKYDDTIPSEITNSTAHTPELSINRVGYQISYLI